MCSHTCVQHLIHSVSIFFKHYFLLNFTILSRLPPKIVELPIPPSTQPNPPFFPLLYHPYPTHRWLHITGSWNWHLSHVDLLSTRTSQDQRGARFKHITATFSQAFCSEKEKRKNITAPFLLGNTLILYCHCLQIRVCRPVTSSLPGNENNTDEVTRQHELFRGTTEQN